ncbi:unnamed protein product [Psylliodes chrysocephalus]|uniref:DUF7869 domain-containing protein n=1 Tax=Psylliodes chrysocephalus TaxID=3402493 RepID=A0A9P0CA87_9CUCU|nr:unnamed protein product [Psylliodes chrysocephala]
MSRGKKLLDIALASALTNPTNSTDWENIIENAPVILLENSDIQNPANSSDTKNITHKLPDPETFKITGNLMEYEENALGLRELVENDIQMEVDGNLGINIMMMEGMIVENNNELITLNRDENPEEYVLENLENAFQENGKEMEERYENEATTLVLRELAENDVHIDVDKNLGANITIMEAIVENNHELVTHNHEEYPEVPEPDNLENMIQNNGREKEERNENEIETRITKKGEQRRRKKFKYSTEKRKIIKRNKLRDSHSVRDGCGDQCKKKCNRKINQERRTDINNQFWNLDREQQHQFMLSCISQTSVKRKTVGLESRRSHTLMYSLKTADGECKPVCRTFFLTTLGFHKNNDKILERFCTSSNSLLAPKPHRNRGKVPHNKLDHAIIEKHIESFHPSISHYRREHAPKRRYLPSDVNIKDMFGDFQMSNRKIPCSYDLYRSIVQKLNISFVTLGHEECEICENFKIHPHSEENLQNDCSDCEKWSKHINRSKDARLLYREYANKEPEEGEVTYSVDLEKIIMLPRCEMFKSVIFIPRLIAYNESFVPVGTKNKNIKPVAAIWHEAIRGRKKEDIISTFHKFFLLKRDAKKIILWVDNCTSQNKNWAFFTFLVYIINSSDISAEVIEINYFEPGHTFMSADAFHHQVEKSLRKMKKVYDFPEFKQAVQQANSGRVTVLEMELRDFYDWQDFSSTYKLKKANSTRPYIHDMVQVTAHRGSMSLLYKNNFSGSDLTLDFLNAKITKTGIPVPPIREKPRGITEERRNIIISKLLEADNAIMPKNRLHFWKELPTTQCLENDNDDD